MRLSALAATVEDAPDGGEPAGGGVPTFVDQPPADQGYFPPPAVPEKGSPEPFVPSPMSQSPPPGPSAPPPVEQFGHGSTPGGPPPALPPQQPSQFSSFPMPQIPPQQPPQFPQATPQFPQASPQFPQVSPQFTPSAPTPVGAPGPSAPPAWSTPSIPHPAMSNPPPAIPQAPAYSAPTGFKPDQKAINQAQKHAKWAISALNFEDVPTAVKELRNALAQLGAQ